VLFLTFLDNTIVSVTLAYIQRLHAGVQTLLPFPGAVVAWVGLAHVHVESGREEQEPARVG